MFFVRVLQLDIGYNLINDPWKVGIFTVIPRMGLPVATQIPDLLFERDNPGFLFSSMSLPCPFSAMFSPIQIAGFSLNCLSLYLHLAVFGDRAFFVFWRQGLLPSAFGFM
jgi:hypothetical protein